MKYAVIYQLYEIIYIYIYIIFLLSFAVMVICSGTIGQFEASYKIHSINDTM